MKTIKLLLVLVLCIHLYGCSKDRDSSLPACIHKKIEEFKSTKICDQSRVDEYEFQKKRVFVFENQYCCCDFTSEVLDSECGYLGSLGGFIGNNKINNEDFSNAKFIKTHWKQ